MLSRFSCVLLFVTLRAVACQAALSMVFSRQEYWSGLPFPPPGDLPHRGIKPVSPALIGGYFTTEPPGKEYVKAVYCHPAYLTYMQRTSCEILDWMKHKLESRLPGEISITSDMQMIPPLK